MNNRPNKVNRTDKLNGEFQKEIYEIITRKLKNPYITEMVSIMKVDCAKDLKNATVFVSIYSKNEEKKSTTFEAIKQDAKRIRHELSCSMHIRTVPELKFVLDNSLEYGEKMDRLLNEIKKDLKDD